MNWDLRNYSDTEEYTDRYIYILIYTQYTDFIPVVWLLFWPLWLYFKQAKVDSNSRVGLGYTTKLRDGTYVTQGGTKHNDVR